MVLVYSTFCFILKPPTFTCFSQLYFQFPNSLLCCIAVTHLCVFISHVVCLLVIRLSCISCGQTTQPFHVFLFFMFDHCLSLVLSGFFFYSPSPSLSLVSHCFPPTHYLCSEHSTSFFGLSLVFVVISFRSAHQCISKCSILWV